MFSQLRQGRGRSIPEPSAPRDFVVRARGGGRHGELCTCGFHFPHPWPVPDDPLALPSIGSHLTPDLVRLLQIERKSVLSTRQMESIFHQHSARHLTNNE